MVEDARPRLIPRNSGSVKTRYGIRKWLPGLLSLLAVLGLCYLLFRPHPSTAVAAGIPVSAVAVAAKDMPIEIRAIGSVTPMNSVAIKSRVDGNITAIHFKEGQFVRQGDPLFTIDPRPLQAAFLSAQADVAKQQALIKQAQASIEKDKAGLVQLQANKAKDQASAANAVTEAKRYLNLANQGAVSKEQSDQMRTNNQTAQATVVADQANMKNGAAVIEADQANLQSARAQLMESQAALQNASVQLGYTTINSPISGLTGVIQTLLGNVVRTDQDTLVTVNQIDPIEVTFPVPQQDFNDVQKYSVTGQLSADAYVPPNKLIASGGKLMFEDNTFDTTTGTAKLKAIFANTNRVLWPGEFVNIVLTLAVEHNAKVVPNSAIQTGQNGQFVFVVSPDMIAHMKPVTTGESHQGLTVVNTGLNPGDLVVTDGQLQLSEGTRVKLTNEKQWGM